MKMRSAFNLFAAFALCVLCSSLAAAQATRTWVSGVGDDANPCSRTAPCKTFAGAISKTAAGGEISVLDPGGFGALTITKSITVNGEGVVAGITASLVNGLIINAGANDVIHIRNLHILGAGNGLDGIRYLAGKQVHIENCSIYGFTGDGIEANLTTNGNLTVKNSSITGLSNGVGSNIGIRVTTSSGQVNVSLDNVRLRGLTTGLDALGGARIAISNSVVANNSNFGIISEVTGVINAEGVMLTGNGTAVQASAGTTIRLSNCDILNNTTGISAVGTVATFQNNRNAGNTTPGAPNQTLTQQ
jgi:hypothetical protein